MLDVFLHVDRAVSERGFRLGPQALGLEPVLLGFALQLFDPFVFCRRFRFPRFQTQPLGLHLARVGAAADPPTAGVARRPDAPLQLTDVLAEIRVLLGGGHPAVQQPDVREVGQRRRGPTQLRHAGQEREHVAVAEGGTNLIASRRESNRQQGVQSEARTTVSAEAETT